MIQTSTRYTKTAVILHWLIAIFLVGMFILGWFMTEIPKEAPKQTAFDLFDLGIYSWQVAQEITPRAFYFNLHKSLGLTIFALIAIRILWRIAHKPPALLTSYSALERKLATGTHHLLYTLMVVIPLTGLVMSIYGKYSVNWFGIELIKGADNKGIRDIFESTHELLGIVLLAFVALHVAGALKHKLIDKDETLKRMSL
ncbi:MAG: cytochrome b [Methylotenera sp.]|uniref:cytochrome b n=1 Tax=Methylotenera sp. TaxID=2051956 RepID=UPI0024893400|nr:cytochrome b [Methylotenera sp.]MDI1308907.1 cytochrome b [Methylotenera sp.]